MAAGQAGRSGALATGGRVAGRGGGRSARLGRARNFRFTFREFQTGTRFGGL